jgi:Ammonia permease
MKFAAVALFIPLWVTLIYFPIAHMVWYWAGPDAIQDAAKALARRLTRRRRPRRRPSSMKSMPTPAGLQEGRDRLRRRHRGAHQRRHRRSRRRAADRQADRLRQGPDGSALADHDHDRRLAALGRLVRLQRRIEPRSQWRRCARHDQLLRQRGGGDVLDVRGVDHQGPSLAARRLSGAVAGSSRSRPRPVTPVRWARSCSVSWSASSACSSAPCEELARLRRLARRVRRPLQSAASSARSAPASW